MKPIKRMSTYQREMQSSSFRKLMERGKNLVEGIEIDINEKLPEEYEVWCTLGEHVVPHGEKWTILYSPQFMIRCYKCARGCY